MFGADLVKIYVSNCKALYNSIQQDFHFGGGTGKSPEVGMCVYLCVCVCVGGGGGEKISVSPTLFIFGIANFKVQSPKHQTWDVDSR